VGLGSGIGNTLQISDFGLRIEIKVAGCSFLVAGSWLLVAGYKGPGKGRPFDFGLRNEKPKNTG
jgi:hypothetical protein